MNPNFNNQKHNYNNQMYYKDGDRFFFVAPFLFGALAGGAVASTVRPRPVFVSSPPTYNQPYPYSSQPAAPNTAYGNASYSYFYPVYK